MEYRKWEIERGVKEKGNEGRTKRGNGVRIKRKRRKMEIMLRK
jgi:hypothetical protein